MPRDSLSSISIQGADASRISQNSVMFDDIYNSRLTTIIIPDS
jgi:hypothetical protein